MGNATLTIAVCLTLLWSGAARAASDEERCQAGRADARGRYELCVQKWLAKFYRLAPFATLVPMDKRLAACRVRYASAWTRLQELADSPTCGGQPRFVDNGNGTVTDNLTRLVWEKKSDDGSIHDQDQLTTWSAGPPFLGDGTAFTTFLNADAASLNAVGFAGAHDWRLPTLAELLTIVRPEPSPQVSAPVPFVDPVFDTACVVGCSVTTCSCTPPLAFWSATADTSPSHAWFVNFHDGTALRTDKISTFYSRAVRGGS